MNKSRDIAKKTAAENDIELLEYNVNVVREGLTNIMKNFFTVGERLSVINDSQGYKAKNYKSFIEFSKAEFGFSKDQSYRIINIYKKFSSDDKYINYSFSQLTEMLSLPVGKLGDVNSDMTVKQIREVKKEVKKDEDKIIKKKDKIDFGKQVEVVDVVPADEKAEFEELMNVSEEVEHLELANKVLKNRKESLETKIDNYKKNNKEKDHIIMVLKQQIENINLANERERERDNKRIEDIKNENANLLSQIADLQKTIREKDIKIETLTKVAELQNKQIEEHSEERKTRRSKATKDKGEIPSS